MKREIDENEARAYLMGKSIVEISRAESQKDDRGLVFGVRVKMENGHSIFMYHERTCCEHVHSSIYGGRVKRVRDIVIETAKNTIYEDYTIDGKLLTLYVNGNSVVDITVSSAGCYIVPTIFFETDIKKCLFGGVL